MEQLNTGIENALLAAGVRYDKFNTLPTDPGQHDIIFATMGCYCLS
ncbi:MAG TPA: hypothetical protein PLI65_05985 [Bacteroidales bacterium]|nr:hypothetical protein [Bacteroidales bacterium]HPR58798.1 hypothetical protein [Bacteroidales bacterium]